MVLVDRFKPQALWHALGCPHRDNHHHVKLRHTILAYCMDQPDNHFILCRFPHAASPYTQGSGTADLKLYPSILF